MNTQQHYINGEWVDSIDGNLVDIINPATGASGGKVILGSSADVDKAVAAAKAAFPAYKKTSIEERLGWLTKITESLLARKEEMARAISTEMGAPISLALNAQAMSGPQHFGEIIRLLQDFKFEEQLGSTLLQHDPIGVCALITPWNWPLNQIATKVAPAIAAGCTMVLKPSELAPQSAAIMAEIIHEAGLPKGVFNLVQGDGQNVGAPLTSHSDIDMVSFTGSTRAGRMIQKAAADDIKRVSLELGGKSACIVADGVDLQKALPKIVGGVMLNTGQSCNATTRLLVPEEQAEAVSQIAAAVAQNLSMGDTTNEAIFMGPIANEAQYNRVQSFMGDAKENGTPFVYDGSAHDVPNEGFYVPPMIVGPVDRDHTLAIEEVFGPVITLMTYKSMDEAIEIANESDYGLSGAVWAGDKEAAVDIARQMRTGMVHINGAQLDSKAPFGGYKQSGNGREWGVYGLHEFLEIKSIYGGAA